MAETQTRMAPPVARDNLPNNAQRLLGEGKSMNCERAETFGLLLDDASVLEMARLEMITPDCELGSIWILCGANG